MPIAECDTQGEIVRPARVSAEAVALTIRFRDQTSPDESPPSTLHRPAKRSR